MRPLAGLLVVDVTRHLPGPFASRELLRLGARVVRVEPPEGDPLRVMAPAWDAALNAGKESVVCDLKADAALAQALLARKTLDEVDAYTAAGFPPPDRGLTGSEIVSAFRRVAFGHDGG